VNAVSFVTCCQQSKKLNSVWLTTELNTVRHDSHSLSLSLTHTHRFETSRFWVLLEGGGGGRGVGCVHWEGAAWPVSRSYHGICLQGLRKTTQNVRQVIKNWLRFKPGTCHIQFYTITNKSTSLLTGLRNHTSKVCMSLSFPTQNLRLCCHSTWRRP
jgi:hypothetical protein